MGRKIRLTIEVVLIVIAILLMIVSKNLSSVYEFLFVDVTNPASLTNDSIGKEITIKVNDNYLNCGDGTYVFVYDDDEGNEKHCKIRIPKTVKESISPNQMFVGNVYVMPESERNSTYKKLEDYYKDLDEATDYFSADELFLSTIKDEISPYAVIVKEAVMVPIFFYSIGVFVFALLLLIVSVLSLIKTYFKIPFIRMGLIVISCLLIATVAIFLVLNKKIKTINSVKCEGKGLYSMTFYEDMKTDSLINANISTVNGMLDWLVKNQFYNIPFELEESNFACAAFTAVSPEGNVLFGRNFDYDNTDSLMIYSDPDDGYASYSMADLKILGISKGIGMDPDEVYSKVFMIACPYMCLDGVNEAGLGVGILELDIGELHQDTGKPDILIYTAIRFLLDKCANVNEAVEFLSQYDMHTSLGVSYHLYITDSSGQSVVVEWLDNEVCVNELNACTNSVLTPGAHFEEGGTDRRLGVIETTLNNSDGILTVEECRDLLKEVAQGAYTEWSCVYDLTNFKAYVYVDVNYVKVYEFGGK